MNTDPIRNDTMPAETAAPPGLPGDIPADASPAWEEIEDGRYMPRRIRGSYRGRVLG
jgi:hypothetical protein